MAQELTNLKSQISNLKSKEPLSGWPMLIFWWAMLLFAVHASTRMVGAGDTWVAMACGRHFLNHGVDTVEPFSANSHKPGPTPEEVKTWPKWAQWLTEKVGLETVKFWHPTGWVNQNWLTHVLFYWLTHESPFADAETFDKPIEEQNISYNSLVYWKYALYIVTIIVVYYTTRVLGVNPALSAVFSCFALFVGRTFFDIRPAGFSNMLTAVLLFIFVLTVYKHHLYIWLLVPTTVLWCNLHGGYVYVFVVLIPFIGLHLLLLLPKKIAMCLCYISGWLLLCALAVKFRLHEYLARIEFSYDGLLFFVSILSGVSIILTSLKNIKADLFHSYHIIGTFIIFIAASTIFYPEGISGLMRQPLFNAYVTDSRLAFFVAFIGFLVTIVMLGLFRNRLRTVSFKCWAHTVAAAVVAFAAMIIANPFRLTNLTHAFVATVGENAKIWKTVNEWHPAFEWSNPVGDEIPFLIMYIIAWVLFALWVICLAMKPKYSAKQGKAKTAIAADSLQYNWPMLDLPLMMIASLTIYMAIGSRRFIPVAAIAACPIMAMFVDTSVRMLAALVNFKKTGKAVLPAFPVTLQRYLIAGALAIVIFLTFWWGYWYKTIYLNPWPDSDYLTSEFMRMTASYVKPFKACQFLRDNNIKGKVFNYWTEGGFIAYGQIPDPNTGKTPLQLFMDGRAQAAYNTKAYNHWMYIMAGGEPAYRAKQAGRAYTDSDYKDIGEWLSNKLQQENVEIVFMPRGQFNSELVKGLDTDPNNWRPVLINDFQRIYADARTQQGIKLYMGMFDGQTKFPDKFSESLTKGWSLLRLQDKNMLKPGYNFVVQAFMQQPSQIAIIELMQTAGRYPEFRDQTAEIFSQYFDDFVENKQNYVKQNGYRYKLASAIMIGEYLARINRQDTELANKYKTYVNQFGAEQRKIGEIMQW